jgi:GT2 family glycosyltransferase
LRTAIITVVHRRAAHLRNQRVALTLGTRTADVHVLVAIDDPTVRDAVTGPGPDAVVVDCDAAGGPLPLASARNMGADTALRGGADLLVFLDVDCLAGAALLQRYQEAAARAEHADALLCGPVTYLPPPGPAGYPLDDLGALVNPHPARPAPADGEVVTADHQRGLFWSLSFAVTSPIWRRIGGFCERYRGYGGEDTDFAQCAAAAGVGMRWVGGAHAFHQHHLVSDPPVEHLDDILLNCTIFHDRWGWWPMSGWLDAFEDRGLIRRDPAGHPVRIGRSPQISGAFV